MRVRRVMAMAMSVVIGLAVTATAEQGSRSVSVLMGDARVTTSADGLTAVVSIDFERDGAPRDGTVDEAFRMQLPEPAAINFSGSATVVYTRDRLVIRPTTSAGWTFAVAGTSKLLDTSADEPFDVVGLAHFWGSSIQASHDEVTTRLLSTTCTTTSLLRPLNSDACSDCAGSGPDCSATCNGSSGCSVSCSGGLVGCCSCAGCRCCRQ